MACHRLSNRCENLQNFRQFACGPSQVYAMAYLFPQKIFRATLLISKLPRPARPKCNSTPDNNPNGVRTTAVVSMASDILNINDCQGLIRDRTETDKGVCRCSCPSESDVAACVTCQQDSPAYRVKLNSRTATSRRAFPSVGVFAQGSCYVPRRL